jgi:hypothetical protein
MGNGMTSVRAVRLSIIAEPRLFQRSAQFNGATAPDFDKDKQKARPRFRSRAFQELIL